MPKIEPYPFTTKDIMLGYIHTPYFSIQLIDTPGMLDRPFDTMNPIEKKAVLAIRHLANLIIYVIDLTETCGYSVEEQLRLLEQIDKTFNIEKWIYFSKTDLFTENEWKKLQELKIDKKYFTDGGKLRQELIEYIKKRKDLYV
jgi:nucleolar GTP-binding protein